MYENRKSIWKAAVTVVLAIGILYLICPGTVPTRAGTQETAQLSEDDLGSIHSQLQQKTLWKPYDGNNVCASQIVTLSDGRKAEIGLQYVSKDAAEELEVNVVSAAIKQDGATSQPVSGSDLGNLKEHSYRGTIAKETLYMELWSGTAIYAHEPDGSYRLSDDSAVELKLVSHPVADEEGIVPTLGAVVWESELSSDGIRSGTVPVVLTDGAGREAVNYQLAQDYSVQARCQEQAEGTDNGEAVVPGAENESQASGSGGTVQTPEESLPPKGSGDDTPGTGKQGQMPAEKATDGQETGDKPSSQPGSGGNGDVEKKDPNTGAKSSDEIQSGVSGQSGRDKTVQPSTPQPDTTQAASPQGVIQPATSQPGTEQPASSHSGEDTSASSKTSAQQSGTSQNVMLSPGSYKDSAYSSAGASSGNNSAVIIEKAGKSVADSPSALVVSGAAAVSGQALGKEKIVIFRTGRGKLWLRRTYRDATGKKTVMLFRAHKKKSENLKKTAPQKLTLVKIRTDADEVSIPVVVKSKKQSWKLSGIRKKAFRKLKQGTAINIMADKQSAYRRLRRQAKRAGLPDGVTVRFQKAG